MPYQTNGKRDYKKEKAWEHRTPGRLEDNKKRVQARRKMIAEGKVKRFDGTHVDHKKALTSGGSNSVKNLRVVSAKTNLAKEAKRKKG